MNWRLVIVPLVAVPVWIGVAVGYVLAPFVAGYRWGLNRHADDLSAMVKQAKEKR